jgi:hypothetical protein
VSFDVTAQLLIIFFASSDTGKQLEYHDTVYQLFIDLRKAYDSVRMEVFYSILIEFGVLMKLVKGN